MCYDDFQLETAGIFIPKLWEVCNTYSNWKSPIMSRSSICLSYKSFMVIMPFKLAVLLLALRIWKIKSQPVHIMTSLQTLNY